MSGGGPSPGMAPPPLINPPWITGDDSGFSFTGGPMGGNAGANSVGGVPNPTGMPQPFNPHGGQPFGVPPIPPIGGPVGQSPFAPGGAQPITGGFDPILIGGNPSGAQGTPPPAGPAFDLSSMNFDAFNLPTWQGPYSAPLVNQQLDALKGFSNFANQNPLTQTLNQVGSGNIQDLGRIFGGTQANLSNFGDISGVVGGIMNAPAQGPGYGASNMTLEEALGLTRARSDYSPVTGQYGQLLNNVPGLTNFGGAQDLLGRAIAAADPTRARGMMDQGTGLAQQFSNYDPITQFYQSVIGGGTNFNTNPMFAAQNAVLESDIARQQATQREQLSSMGLADSTDFTQALARTSNEARNQLNAQQLAQQFQAFENEQARRMGAAQGWAGTLGQGYGERANAAGLFGQLAGLDTQTAQGLANTLMQGSGMAAQLAQMPFQQQMAIRSQIGQLLPAFADVLGRGTQEAFQASQLATGIGGQQSTNAARAAQEAQYAQQIQLQAAQQQAQMEQMRYEQEFNRQQAEAAAMQQAMQAIQQQSNMFQDLYGMGEAARSVADAEVMRRMQENARTQGAGLDQMLKFMASQPGLETGFTPSGASQVAGTIPGIAELINMGIDIYDLVR